MVTDGNYIYHGDHFIIQKKILNHYVVDLKLI